MFEEVSCSKHKEMLTNGVLQHNNAQPHTAAVSVETIKKLKFELLPHPIYSPDPGPSDHNIF
jgi:hypothetical protein